MTSRLRTGLGALALTVLLSAALSLGAAPAPAQAQGKMKKKIEEVLTHGGGLAETEDDAQTLALVQRVYQEREFKPFWTTREGATKPGKELARAIANLDKDGLTPADYGAARLIELVEDGDRRVEKAELDVLLSVALVRAAVDLANGRVIANQLNPDTFAVVRDLDRAEVLRKADNLKAGEVEAYLLSYAPQQDNYARLKEGLARFRALEAAGGWPTDLPAGETIDPGMTDPRVPMIRDRIILLGDLQPADNAAASGGPSDLYDPALVEAVKRFQQRHGLDVDGRIGKGTITDLNVPVSARIQQIIMNMERRRWMPDQWERRYVFVNQADFHLKVVDTIDGREKTIFTSNVVVGTPFHKTPVFSHQISYLEFNPYWNVPPSIAGRVLLPKLKKNPNYAAENGYDVFTDWSANAGLVNASAIDWSQYSRGNLPYKFRQRPGPNNALGRVKFMFPNPHSIYLHDTPARSHFSRTQRAFSSGCIRVHKPLELAAVLLSFENGDWDVARAQAIVDGGERTIVTLKEKIPVHLYYVTSWVNKDGSIHFREDIYGRDAILANALFGAAALTR